MSEEKKCPCSQDKPYEACCQPFHQGKTDPSNALELMRSRYSAYVYNLPDYIIETTHPGSPQYCNDLALWKHRISDFSLHSQFQKLEILDFKERGNLATVTFVAHVFQGKQDVTFTEKSFFEKIRGKWFYRSGHLAEGHLPNFLTTGQLRLLPLAYYGAPVLRRKADPIIEITPELRVLIEEMIETMDACDGIGLAAPQVHHSIRLFVIREPIEVDGGVTCGDVRVLINPKLSEFSEETWKASEGCLSIPTIHADVTRPREITVDYTDLEGKHHRERLTGWAARVVMHENDHIDGVLFIDHLSREELEKHEPFLQRLEHRIHNGTEL